MKIQFDEVVKILDGEYSWCNDHPENVDPVFRAGFMAGIQQAKRLITGLMEVDSTQERHVYVFDYGKDQVGR